MTGIEPLYHNVSNPYQFMKSKKKKDFFAGRVVDYDKPDSYPGWEELLTI